LKNKIQFSYNKENFGQVKCVWNMECSLPIFPRFYAFTI